MNLKHQFYFISGVMVLLAGSLELSGAQSTNTIPPGGTIAPAWLTEPLSLPEALDLALRQNSAVLKSKSDIEAAYGVSIQTRAIGLPRVRSGSSYTFNQALETLKFVLPTNFTGITPGENNWDANIEVVQAIYEGGKITSAFRTARLTREQAVLQHDTVIADTLFAVRTAYYDVLLAAQQIVVQEASLQLLQKELLDATRRFEAGTRPRFDVLRAEVAVANARPGVIRARNSFRITKNNLANLLGYNIPPEVWEDIPMHLTDKLEARPMSIELPAALDQALKNRTELGVLRKAEGLRREGVVVAKAGYKPTLEIFGGYSARSPRLTNDFFNSDVSGWEAGVRMTWNIFDGNQTRGRIKEAQAQLERARLDLDDTMRRIELEVRTAYSQFIEAKEVLESQRKVQEQAEESLRLAKAREGAGTWTQLDVLDAETALTSARTTQIQALRDYEVARARLERAIGIIFQKKAQP